MNLKNKLAPWIPNCYPLPTCTTGVEVVTIIRTTKRYSNQEDFIIRDSNYVVYYRLLSVKNKKKYTWSVILCKGSYLIVMADSYGDGWSFGSNVVIKVGSTTIGTYSYYDYSSSYTFAV